MPSLTLAPVAEPAARAVALAIRMVLRGYRWIVSPLLGPACRFEPSCSRYAEHAIERHGCLHGGALALSRIARCHPWGGPGGFDPVP